MFRPRVIPALLLSGRGLVKTVTFDHPRYVGDPINAARIFNSKGADELLLLDIRATLEQRGPPVGLIRQISDETFMPLAVGGGIRSVDDVRALLNAGAEKVVINTRAIENPGLIRDVADQFGSQSVIGSIDARRGRDGGYRVFTHHGSRRRKEDPVEVAGELEAMGVGEIMITSIDRDGTMEGFDLRLVRSVADAVSVPVIASGGAGSLDDLRKAIQEANASAVAAGSLFVYHGARRAVLISYPSRTEIESLLGEA